MTKIDNDVLKLQHKKALHQLCKAFIQDIDEYDEILVANRGYEIKYNDNGRIRTYQVVLSIKEVE